MQSPCPFILQLEEKLTIHSGTGVNFSIIASNVLITNNELAQFNAWCLNNGNHSTPKRGHEDWNAKIIWKMRTELDYQWDLVEDEISVVFEQLLKSTEEVLASLRETVLGEFATDYASFSSN